MSITKKRSSKVLIKKSFSRLFKYISQSFQKDRLQATHKGRFLLLWWALVPRFKWYATNLLSLGLSDISSSLLHHSYNIDTDKI